MERKFDEKEFEEYLMSTTCPNWISLTMIKKNQYDSYLSPMMILACQKIQDSRIDGVLFISPDISAQEFYAKLLAIKVKAVPHIMCLGFYQSKENLIASSLMNYYQKGGIVCLQGIEYLPDDVFEMLWEILHSETYNFEGRTYHKHSNFVFYLLVNNYTENRHRIKSILNRSDSSILIVNHEIWNRQEFANIMQLLYGKKLLSREFYEMLFNVIKYFKQEEPDRREIFEYTQRFINLITKDFLSCDEFVERILSFYLGEEDLRFKNNPILGAGLDALYQLYKRDSYNYASWFIMFILRNGESDKDCFGYQVLKAKQEEEDALKKLNELRRKVSTPSIEEVSDEKERNRILGELAARFGKPEKKEEEKKDMSIKIEIKEDKTYNNVAEKNRFSEVSLEKMFCIGEDFHGAKPGCSKALRERFENIKIPKNGLPTVNRVCINKDTNMTMLQFSNGDSVSVYRDPEDQDDLEKAVAIAMVKYAWGYLENEKAMKRVVNATKKPKNKKKPGELKPTFLAPQDELKKKKVARRKPAEEAPKDETPKKTTHRKPGPKKSKLQYTLDEMADKFRSTKGGE